MLYYKRYDHRRILISLVQWGWRIPFLIGGVLAIISYFIRLKLSETPAFEYYKGNNVNKNVSILKLFSKNYFILVIIAICMNLYSASLIIFNLYLPSYLSNYLHYTASKISFLISLGIFWAALLSIMFGKLVDKVGILKIMFGAHIIFILIGYIIFASLKTSNIIYPITLIILYQTILAATTVCYFTLIFKLFPVEIRYSAISLCYNVSIVIASFTPVILINFIYYIKDCTLAPYIFIFFELIKPDIVFTL